MYRRKIADRHSRIRRRTRHYRIDRLEARRLLAADLVISEFLAANQNSLVDEYGNSSDWIEIHNAGDAPANLGDYFLTDDATKPEKWQFPTEQLAAGGYLIVFASGENQAVAGEELHTNFKLSASGGYLGLIGPSDVPQFQYISYPAQSADISYGLSNADDPNSPVVFFATPTPDAPNIPTASEPTFSQPNQTFTGSLTVSLSSSTPGAEIYYTTDNSTPSASSTLYSGPITLTSTTMILAIASAGGVATSPIASASYIAVDSSVAGFNNNIGIVVVDTHGQALNDTTDTLATAAFINTDAAGEADMLGTPDYIGSIGLHIRGFSSETFPKQQFSVTLLDANQNSTNASLLGMPSDSDWILYDPYSEKSLMQNALAMQWASEMGEYASPTRYVELFLNTDGSSQIDYSSHYWGVYILMEKIKISPDRVNITQMNSTDNTDPDDTGGYIWSQDHIDADDLTFTTDVDDITYIFVEPGASDITPQQQSYLTNYLDQFETALYGPNFTNPTTGYAAYIDVDSFIDYYLLSEMTKNVDAFSYSEYYYKDENGKIEMGPAWDFNESLGNANFSGGNDPTGWIEAPADSYFNQLLQDPVFKQEVVERWAQLRQTVFSTSQLMADIDAQVGILSDNNGNYPVGDNPTQTPNNPIVRNYDRWNVLGEYVWPNGYYDPSGSWITDVQMMKSWLTERVAWMDSQLLPAVAITPTGGTETAPVQISMNSQSSVSADSILLGADAPATAMVPTGDISGWQNPGFDDSAWLSGTLGAGFNSDTTDYNSLIGLNLGSMQNVNATVYIRINFNVSDPSSVQGLILQMQYDDGFVAYLNGVEIASANAPTTLVWNSGATAQHDGSQATNVEEFDISAFKNYLVSGNNVLAIQGLNLSATSNDFLINAQLVSRLWITPTAAPIYYTTDGSDPEAADGSISPSAALYVNPLTLSFSTLVESRTLVDGVWSALVSSQYQFGASDVRITELDYDPSKPAKGSAYNNDDFEFVELENFGSQTVSLYGVSFTDGIDYTFGYVTLAPGQVGVLVNNPDAFTSRYGTGVYVLGNYESTGQNFSNSGEHVELVDALGNALDDFTYSSSWYSSTHGSGGTLEVIDPTASPDLNQAASWRVSPVTDGTPGTVPLLLSGNAYLEMDANGEYLDVFDNNNGAGTPDQFVLLSSLYSIAYTNPAGGGSLSINFTNGNPLIPTGTSFDGTGGSNNLFIIGTSGADTLSVNASTLTLAAAFGSASMNYLNAANIFFTGNGGGDTLTQLAQPSGGALLTFLSPTAQDILNVSAGTYTIAAPPAGSGSVNEYFGTLSAAAGAQIVLAPADDASDQTILIVPNLSLAGVLDIANNELLVPYTNASPLAGIVAMLAGGYNAGAWNGPSGIISSTAAADPNAITALGYFDDGNQITVLQAFYGDANLDGRVNADDFSLLLRGQAISGTGWQNGDFNYDNTINNADVALADQAAAVIPLIMKNTQIQKSATRAQSFSNIPVLVNLADPIDDLLNDQADILA